MRKIIEVYISVFFTILILLMIIVYASASERQLIDLAKSHLKNNEYYNAITEIMRYQYLYPKGKHYSLSLLMMGKAYYMGGNRKEAFNTMRLCYDKFKGKPEGEKALFYMGYIRLSTGSPYYAYRTYLEYNYIYKKNGLYKEDVNTDICHAKALMNDLEDSMIGILNYRKEYPAGKYINNLNNLEKLINNELNRPKKSVWISVLGSIFIPGFGHFYTGKYGIGFFSFFTNATLLYLIYDGYRDNDKFRMIFFGLVELSFYQHSIFSAVNNVYEYNSRKNFYKDVKFGIVKRL